ncbi:MAG: ABC transporter ATP-binding protein [Oscillospiraceae bacterium]|nr:ABC transporter ATP-binding protein [Oscillospiraceae bacterium]
MIEFRKVSKRYPGAAEPVLREVSFEIPKGQLTVFVGPSGCGKTTSLKMINRLIEPTEGEILVNGQNILQQDPIALRRSIGYVVQSTGLLPHLTIRENIEIVARLGGKKPAELLDSTVRLMHMVNLPPEQYLHRYPRQLSGGQQQRVGVARAFAADPEIILMDEPFSALDPITRTQLQDELLQLQEKLQRTIVFVTHDMDEAIRIADRIAIMNKGQLVQYDTPEHILKHPADEFVDRFVDTSRIWGRPEMIRVRDIMLNAPITARRRDTLLRGVRRMRECRVDSLLIVDGEHRFLGRVAISGLPRGLHAETPLEEVMQRDIPTILPQANMVQALEQIHSAGVSMLPVVDEDGRLQGLVTQASLVSTMSRQFIDLEEV